MPALRKHPVMRMDNERKDSPKANRDLPPTADHLVRTMRIDDGELRAQRPSVKKAFLNVIRSRADLGAHVFVEGPITLGRDPNCNLSLHDFRVSWRHAVITPESNGTYLLEDLRSTNGTRVDGNPVEHQHRLKDGEKIFVGESVIRFSLADEVDFDFHSEVAACVGTDPLTGLPSKRQFDQTLEFALQAAINGEGPLTILMMDMDGVKQINDRHGHLFGAHVIGETGRLIARVLGSRGRACRFGGDEFSLFLPNCDTESACQMAEQIRLAVENAGFEKEGIALRPTISIGVAGYPAEGESLLTLVAAADRALYRAKANGKNCVAR